MPDQLPASAGPVGDLPDAWVEALTRVDFDAYRGDLGDIETFKRENPRSWADWLDVNRERLAAVVPLIRAHLADELHEEAQNVRPDSTREWLTHWLGAALRGGTDAG